MSKFYNKLKEFDFKLISDYKNAKTSVTISCNKCLEEVNVIPSNFSHRGYSCKRCSRKSLIDESCKEKNYSLIDFDDERVFLKCNSCSNDFDCSFVRLRISGNDNCPSCSNSKLKNLEICNAEIINKFQGYMNLIMIEYRGSREKSLYKCSDCHKLNEKYHHKVMGGSKCDFCRKSNNIWADDLYFNLINEFKLEVEREVTFEDLKSGINQNYSLRFDFGVYHKNKLICLIEFDGEQHYKPIEFFGGESSFENQKSNDNTKNEYCENMNIPLIRVRQRNYARYRNYNLQILKNNIDSILNDYR